MIPVDVIKLYPKKAASKAYSEVVKPKATKEFAEANRYLRELQMLTFKGQFTDVEYTIEWVNGQELFTVKGAFRIDFSNVGITLNLIDIVIRHLVSKVENRQDQFSATILKECYIGDRYLETA